MRKHAFFKTSFSIWTGNNLPTKEDTLPIVKFAMSQILAVVNGSMTSEQMIKSVGILSELTPAIWNGNIQVSSKVIEKRINNQPHFVYVDEHGRDR